MPGIKGVEGEGGLKDLGHWVENSVLDRNGRKTQWIPGRKIICFVCLFLDFEPQVPMFACPNDIGCPGI